MFFLQYKFKYPIKMQAAYEGKLLPVTDKQTRRVSRVVDRLLEGSNGMPGFENKTWTVSIIDSPEFNAFVLPVSERLCSDYGDTVFF